MITQNIKNANLYFGLGERIAKGLKYLQQTDFSVIREEALLLQKKGTMLKMVKE